MVYARVFLYRTTHGVLTLVMAWLAILLIEPEPSLLTSAARLMIALMPEPDWGILCALVAVIGALALLTENYTLRMVSAGVLGAAHLAIGALLFVANPHAIGSALFFGYAILGGALAYSTAYVQQRAKENVGPAHLS